MPSSSSSSSEAAAASAEPARDQDEDPPPLTRDPGPVGRRGAGLGPLVAERHEEVAAELLGELGLQEGLHEDLEALKVDLLEGRRQDESESVVRVQGHLLFLVMTVFNANLFISLALPPCFCSYLQKLV